MVHTLKWATAHLSIRWGAQAWCWVAGCTGAGPAGVGRAGAQARDTGAQACGLSAPCARPGPAGCALGAPNLFLDSVLFLSHCLDIVHEHCSPNFFEKKMNEIKFLKK